MRNEIKNRKNAWLVEKDACVSWTNHKRNDDYFDIHLKIAEIMTSLTWLFPFTPFTLSSGRKSVLNFAEVFEIILILLFLISFLCCVISSENSCHFVNHWDSKLLSFGSFNCLKNQFQHALQAVSILIGYFWYFPLFWFAVVITLVLRHSVDISSFSMTSLKTNSYDCNKKFQQL